MSAAREARRCGVRRRSVGWGIAKWVLCGAAVSWSGACVAAQDAAPPPERPAPPPVPRERGGAPAAAPTEGAARVVRVTAAGYSRDDALKQALRKALETGAGAQLAGYSQVENYQLVADTIYSRAAGIVRDYRVLKEEEIANGDWEVTLEATVRSSAVAEAWGEVQHVLDQIGRPKIMVWIDEEIDGKDQKHSIVEAGIEELLTKAGFDLVAREGLAELRQRESAAARAEGDPVKLARRARDAGAQILIRGAAHANSAGVADLYGTPAAFYNCDVQAKAYYTDTGRLLTSESIPVTRRGARGRRDHSPQAARAALEAATFPRNPQRREATLATKLLESIMEQWSTQITAGGDLQLDVEGVDFRGYVELRRALADLERVRSVDGDFSKGAAQYRIKTTIGAQTFAELLAERPFADWIEVVDLKAGRIQARALRAESSSTLPAPVAPPAR